jgi:hypothetical protein
VNPEDPPNEPIEDEKPQQEQLSEEARQKLRDWGHGL